jgi:hypothetical protein
MVNVKALAGLVWFKSRSKVQFPYIYQNTISRKRTNKCPKFNILPMGMPESNPWAEGHLAMPKSIPGRASQKM